MILNVKNCVLSSLTEKLEKSIPQFSLRAVGKSTNIETLTDFEAPEILCYGLASVSRVLANWVWLEPELLNRTWQGSFTSGSTLNYWPFIGIAQLFTIADLLCTMCYASSASCIICTVWLEEHCEVVAHTSRTRHSTTKIGRAHSV